MRRCPRALGAVLLVALAGCAPGYVLRAAYEEARILWRRQPIEELLAGDASAEMRAKLELALAVRAFARDQLGLRVKGSYRTYSTVDADQVVHIVTAARRDRLELYTWWFPIVGRVPYRGYFDPEDAKALAADLERDGYDTYVRPAIAFSTLGWFDDPLLSNVLRYDEVLLADVVIHELLHNTVYLRGQTAFDESFASFVGCEGAAAFFAARDARELAERAGAHCADDRTFSRFLGALIARLEAAYRGGLDRAGRDVLFRDAQAVFAAEPWLTKQYDGFDRITLNNAILLHHWLYAQRLDLFAVAHQRHGGDLRRTIAWVIQIASDQADPFAALAAAVCHGGAACNESRAAAVP